MRVEFPCYVFISFTFLFLVIVCNSQDPVDHTGYSCTKSAYRYYLQAQIFSLCFGFFRAAEIVYVLVRRICSADVKKSWSAFQR